MIPVPLILAHDPAPPNGVRVVAARAPALPAHIDLALAPGGTILDVLKAAGADPVFFSHGFVKLVDLKRPDRSMAVPRDLWARVRPKDGTLVLAGVRPLGGGGGGGGGKNITRIVLSLAVVVAAFAVGAYVGAQPFASSFAFNIGGAQFNVLGALAGGVTTLVGNALVTAIVPPPPARISEAATIRGVDAGQTLYSISGASNRARPWQPIPEVYGKRRVFPDLGAEIFTETVNNKTYLRMLLCVGRGPLKLSDFKIGETPLADFTSVESETREGFDDDAPLTLYTDDIHTDPVGAALTQAGGWVSRRSIIDADELMVDISFPQGLVRLVDQSSRASQSVEFDVEISPAGADDWTAPTWANAADQGFGTPGRIVAADTIAGSEVRRTGRLKTPSRGQYDVRVRRLTADTGSNDIIDTAQWAVLRGLTYRQPFAKKGCALWALRILATEQTNQVIDTANCIAEAYYRLYDEQTETWDWGLSRTPADAFIKVLTRAKRALPVDRLNLANLMAWRADCVAANANGNPKFTFDAVYQSEGSNRQVLTDIAAAGRARMGMPGGKWGVIRDVAQSTYRQMITPTNSWGFRETESYTELPDGFLVQFEDEEAGYRVNQIPVYADGQTAATAQKFERLEFIGVTRHEQAWSEGRYHYAGAVLRPSTYQVRMDVEHMDFERGDLVLAAHPTIVVGLGDGRVAETIMAVPEGGGAPEIVGIRLTEKVVMEAGKSYGVRIRRASATGDRVTATLEVKTEPGETDTLTFWNPDLNAVRVPAADEAPAPDDVAAFGEAGREAAPFLVSGIVPERDHVATITLVDHAPAVLTADQGPIPARDTFMTKPPAADRRPPKPVVIGIASDESVMTALPGGGWQPRIVITLAERDFAGQPPGLLHVQVKRSDSEKWGRRPNLPGNAAQVSVDGVVQGTAYDVQITYVTPLGAASDPVPILGHVVVGKATPPPAVAHVAVENGAAIWSYPAPPKDFAGFQVWHRAGAVKSLSGAERAHAGLYAVSPFDLSHLPGGLRTVMVVALDEDGNRSEPVAIFLELVAPDTSNVIVTRDLAAEGFPGVIVNGAVAGGALEGGDNGDDYLPDDGALYLPADGEDYLPVTFTEMTWTFPFSPPTEAVPCNTVLSFSVEGDNWTLDYRPPDAGVYLPMDDDDYLGADGDGYLGDGTPPWMPWPGSLAMGRERIDFRLKTLGGNTQGRVTAFVASMDVPDLIESLSGVVLASGGTRLPIAKPFRAIANVSGITLISGGGDAVRVEVVDRDHTIGPLLQGYDAAGDPAGGVVDVSTIKGY